MDNKKQLYLSLAFPIALMFGWLGLVMLERANATTVQIPIRGFDPRDLLSGHYLTYQLDFGDVKVCGDRYSEESICVCLDNSNAPAKPTHAASCADTTCPLFLKGNCKYGTFNAGVERFYFSEKYTKELAIVPQKSNIELKITDVGVGYVEDLIIDGKRVAEWLKAEKAKANETNL